MGVIFNVLFVAGKEIMMSFFAVRLKLTFFVLFD